MDRRANGERESANYRIKSSEIASMADSGSISEKYAIDYYRQSLPTRSWKSRWNYTALLLALLACAGMYAIRRNAVFQAAPIASAHSSFGASCVTCHDQSWGAGLRLASIGHEHPSVSNDACQKCHRAGPHAAVALLEPACADCHQEHRPEKRLTELANSACTQCHQNLAGVTTVAASVAGEITRFERGVGGHPEFAVLRTTPEGIGTRHAAHSLAQFVEASPGKGHWVDRGGVKFNHSLHLDPTRVLGLDRKPVKLTCSDCHIRDSDGYMQPIAYEAQCRKCHPLKLAEPFNGLGDLPHGSVENVRGVIRDRLAKQIEQTSQKPSDVVQDGRLLHLPQPASLTTAQEHDLAAQIQTADHAIFGVEAKGGCVHCHYIDAVQGEWHVHMTNPTLAIDKSAPPEMNVTEMIPSRWLRQATFDHKSHRAIECNECHKAVESSKTTDILLPSIAVCQTCHGNDAQTSGPHVSGNCILCHTYHNDIGPKQVNGVSLQQLFPNAQAHSTESMR